MNYYTKTGNNFILYAVSRLSNQGITKNSIPLARFKSCRNNSF
jgi:hypothetical protein